MDTLLLVRKYDNIKKKGPSDEISSLGTAGKRDGLLRAPSVFATNTVITVRCQFCAHTPNSDCSQPLSLSLLLACLPTVLGYRTRIALASNMRPTISSAKEEISRDRFCDRVPQLLEGVNLCIIISMGV